MLHGAHCGGRRTSLCYGRLVANAVRKGYEEKKQNIFARELRYGEVQKIQFVCTETSICDRDDEPELVAAAAAVVLVIVVVEEEEDEEEEEEKE